MSVAPSDLADAVATAHDAYPTEGNFNYAFSDDAPTRWEVLPRLIGKESKRLVVKGGAEASGFFNYTDNGTSGFAQPGSNVSIAITNILKKWSVPFREVRAYYGVFDREVEMNMEPERLIPLVQTRKVSTQMDMAKTVEQDFFAAPDATSELRPNNLAVMCTPITTTQVAAATTLTGAFQGSNPTGYTSGVQGVDLDTYTRWKNWNFEWSNSSGDVMDADVDNLTRMFDALDFQVPPTVEDLKDPVFDRCRVYLTEDTKLSMIARSRGQNDQVGFDVAAGARSVNFMQYPLVRIKSLETYSAYRGYYPVYFVNWRYLFPVVREGRVFTRRTFQPTANMPDLVVTWMFLEYNMLTINRKLACGMGSYVA